MADLRCSFCNKGEADVHKIIAGRQDVAICNECVEVCNDILADRRERQPPPDEHEPPDEGPELFSFKCPACGHQWKVAKR